MMNKIKSLLPLTMIFVAACERSEAPAPIPAPAPTPSPTPLPEPDPAPPPSPGANVTKVFSAGSLIIPTSGTYQTSCGAVSAYGLIYNVLRANNWLVANGYPQVRVYYSFNADKTAPNRCVPTNKHMPPAPNTGVYTDPQWNNGCDFSVTRATGRPVREITNTSGSNAATDIDLVTVNTVGSPSIFPQYGATTVDASATRIQYNGGPFIIDAAHAATFTNLLQGAIIAQDDFGNNIDFLPFRSNRNTCAFPNPPALQHYVRIHRAQAAFIANDNLSFSATPPRLALLATNNAGMTARVDDGILQKYLVNAGLAFTGANGCPPGGKNASKKSICPNGGQPGQIYDTFDFADIKSNLHALTDGTGKPLYSSVWAPHWETTAGSNTNPNSNEVAAVNNLDNWLNGSNGFMGECHSIEAIEGAYRNGSKDQTKTQALLTCLDANNDGVCDAGSTKWGIDKSISNTPAGQLRNCSDPNMTTGSKCAYHGYPGDSFSQTADYVWDAVNGSVENWKPNTTEKTIYRPGTFVTISGVQALDKTKLSNPSVARAMIKADYVMYGFKNSNPAQGAVHYLGGHDQSSSLAGNLVVMQTLLQLGTPPTSIAPVTKEVARSSPIIANVNGTEQLFQGSFERVTPAPVAGLLADNDANLTIYEYPKKRGHFRGYLTADITTTTSLFTDVGSVFDAANFIPPPTYGGCGTYFTSSCRTVFTNLSLTDHLGNPCTAGGTCRLPNSGNGPGKPLFINAAAKTVLAPIMFPGVSLANRDTALSRVLAGFNNSGTYIPKLGGIDRSTVTIVGPSTVDGGSAGVRPTMAYVGATDGMLHAFCLNVAGNCDAIGRELWAFLPRSQLTKVASNTAVIDGSPRAADIFGDFDNDGTSEFRTILTFTTANHSNLIPADAASVYALDITDPSDPRIVWEYTTPTARSAFELGNGLTIAMAKAPVSIPATGTKQVTFVQTNNFGIPAVSGSVVTAFDTETGGILWKHKYAYPTPTRSGGTPEPGTGIPGGVVAVDMNLAGTGTVTDIVFGDLYGNLWQIATDAPLHTGTNMITPKNGFDVGLDGVPNTIDDRPLPLFSMSTDQKPIGAPPALFAQLPNLYAVFTTGGYADPFGLATWASGIHKVVAVRLLKANEPATLPGVPANELSAVPDPIKFQADLDATAGDDRGFSQALVVGNEIFVNTDSSDVNDNSDLTGYGLGTSSGNTYKFDINGAASPGVVVAGGASSLVNSGTSIYGASSSGMQQLTTSATSAVGTKVDYTSSSAAKVTRILWLRGE
ncbi:MAG: hypothetical protein KF773_05630 [Deltaproteobacteria bacterium]|nr:hypothetical protein [Deltaproteobacteria bacterium]